MSESKSLDVELQSALTAAFGERYQLSEKLGTGAYGVVFRARDTMLDRDVAIKQVRLDRFQDEAQATEVKRRTEREAKMAAKLRHTGIVAVHDIVHAGASTLIIMEYVNGETLEAKLRRQRRLSLDEAIDVIAQTADALDHAHAQGVVHRDVKPANLMIDANGRVKIADFGIAKSQAGSEKTSNITATGNVLGTPYYMSPEQARGDDLLDGRSDLFSLGCVTYECLAGDKPFRGKSVIDVLLNIVHHEPAELDCDGLELHPGIESVIGRVLAKSSADRFATASDLVAALRAVPAAEPTGTPSSLPVVTHRDPGATFSIDIEIQGSLTGRGLADVIRDIQTAGTTGILHLQRDQLSKRLYFLDGAIVFANSDVESDRLGQVLIAGGVIDSPSYERASLAMKKSRKRLGRTLVALGDLEEEKLDAVITDQIQRIIYSVFSWDSGAYGFETIDKPVEEDIALELATDKIVLEAVRQMATESTIRHGIGNVDRILQHARDIQTSPVTLTSAEGFVLSRVDGMTSVAEITALSPLGEDETLRCIYGLVSAGILRLEDAKGKATGRATPVRAAADPVAPETPAATEQPVRNASREASVDRFLEQISTKLASIEDANYYQILEVSSADTPVVIKKSYYALAKKFHPDRHQVAKDENLRSQLEEILGKLSKAYDVLSVSSSRLRYDAKLARNKSTDPESVGTLQTSPSILAETKYRAGKGFYQAQDYHEAVQYLREAVRLAPNKLAYHKLLGKALTKNPKWRKQAETHLRRVIAAQPYDAECYFELAMIYEEGGLSTRARKMYEQVVSLDPDHEVAREKLEGRPRGSASRRKSPGNTDTSAH